VFGFSLYFFFGFLQERYRGKKSEKKECSEPSGRFATEGFSNDNELSSKTPVVMKN
jgi:hypothetical protein